MREQAMLALLECRTLKEAAERAGVSVSALHAWRADPEFAAEFEALAARVRERAVADISASLEGSARYLRQLVEDENEKTQDRAAAAKTLLSFGLRERERQQDRRPPVTDLPERLNDAAQAVVRDLLVHPNEQVRLRAAQVLIELRSGTDRLERWLEAVREAQGQAHLDIQMPEGPNPWQPEGED